MLSEDKYFHTLTEDELWKRYCGFLDLSIDQFMDIQREFLMDEIELVANSILGKKIMNNQKPKSVEEFRQVVPLTTYDDYEPYLSEQREDALAIKPHRWCHSSGKGGRFKWFPVAVEEFDKTTRNFLSICILASCGKKREVNIGTEFRFLAIWPPPPYPSGTSIEYIGQHFTYQHVPPHEMVKDLEIQQRMQKGFQIALRDGVDVLGAISSVLVRMGEGFAEQTRKMQFSTAMLHPKVIFRMLRAKLRSTREKRVILPKDLWTPKGIMCGGMDTNVYKDEIARYWGKEPFDFYASTETMFVAVTPWNNKALAFLPDSVFLEFIPCEEQLKHKEDKDYQPSTVLLNELEEGKLYEVIITQFHGMPLLRYRLGDIIRIVSLKDEETGVNLPQIAIQGRVGETIYLAGMCSLDEKTIWQAIANTGIKYMDWIACKEYDENQTHLRIYLELKEEKEPTEIASMIDEQLKIVDTDYKDIGDYLKLQPVKVTLLSRGTFWEYMQEKRREGADIAQLKPTHMNASEAIIQHLLQLSETASEK
ncbi:GH3 auxin-responsive promoter family protein [Chloroflexota bacterium]